MEYSYSIKDSFYFKMWIGFFFFFSKSGGALAPRPLPLCGLWHEFTAKGFIEVSLLKRQLKEVALSSVGFIMLRLALVVSQFPAEYFGKLPGLNL